MPGDERQRWCRWLFYSAIWAKAVALLPRKEWITHEELVGALTLTGWSEGALDGIFDALEREGIVETDADLNLRRVAAK